MSWETGANRGGAVNLTHQKIPARAEVGRAMNGQTILSDRVMTSHQAAAPLWKRALDIFLIALFSPAILFVGAIVTLIVRCGSRGPILFRQKRVGFGGREFTCYKFRTMKVNADTTRHRDYTRQLINSETPMVKLDASSDPRLVPFGTILRATGLDELPQFINVLKGEMSIVGPRPCIPYEFELYEPWQRRRFDAVPGLTGLWQVSGKNRTTFNQMIRLDIEYSERASLWLDLQIIFRTLPALWTQCAETRALKRAQNNQEVKTIRLNNL